MKKYNEAVYCIAMLCCTAVWCKRCRSRSWVATYLPKITHLPSSSKIGPKLDYAKTKVSFISWEALRGHGGGWWRCAARESWTDSTAATTSPILFLHSLVLAQQGVAEDIIELFAMDTASSLKKRSSIKSWGCMLILFLSLSISASDMLLYIGLESVRGNWRL